MWINDRSPSIHHGAPRGCHSFPCLKECKYNLPQPSQQPSNKKCHNERIQYHTSHISPTPSKPTKFNPISMMTQLLLMILKDKLSLVLCTPKNDQQIILATTPIPTNKTKFQKFFNVSTTHIITKNQSNICVSCHLLSNQSLSSIKFKSMNNHLLAWLNQA